HASRRGCDAAATIVTATLHACGLFTSTPRRRTAVASAYASRVGIGRGNRAPHRAARGDLPVVLRRPPFARLGTTIGRMAARILVVEDDPDIAALVGRYLDKAGFLSECAASGREALTAIEARPPDLIILDLMLPLVDGLEVCRVIRGNDRTAGLPIIMLT